MIYEIEVTSKVTLEIEADSEEEAIEKACGEAWEHDADEINAEIVQRIMPAKEAIALFEKANAEDTDPERNAFRRRLEKALRGGRFYEEED